MKLKFFSDDSTILTPEDVVFYILSWLDLKTQNSSALVCKDWNKWLSIYKKIQSSLNQIPQFSELGLVNFKVNFMLGGMTNTSFIIKKRTAPERWVLRIPGTGSSVFIDRKYEAANALQASQLGLNVEIAYSDPINGLQLTHYVENISSWDTITLDEAVLGNIAKLMHQLHSSKLFANHTSIFERNDDFIKVLKSKAFIFPGDISFIEEQMKQLEMLVSKFKIKLRPCHNDATLLNFMVTSDKSKKHLKTYMIDWEYSSNNDLMWDLAYFAVEAKLNSLQTDQFLKAYFGDSWSSNSILSWFEIYKPIVEWWITIWYWTQLSNKANAVDLSLYEKCGESSYNKTIEFLKSKEFTSAVKAIDEEETLTSGFRAF